MSLRSLSLFLVCAVLMGVSPKIHASTIDVGIGGIEDCTFQCTDRLQQVYASSSFSGPVLIDSVSFFASITFVNSPTTWNGTSTWQMTLSTSVYPVGALDPTYANNVGGDAALFDTKTFTGTQSHNDLITFDGPGSFYYDPGNGNLLVDIVRIAGTAGGVDLDAGQPQGGVTDRLYSIYGTTTADVGNYDYGLRTRFAFVPEPASGLLVALGLVGLTARRR